MFSLSLSLFLLPVNKISGRESWLSLSLSLSSFLLDGKGRRGLGRRWPTAGDAPWSSVCGVLVVPRPAMAGRATPYDGRPAGTEEEKAEPARLLHHSGGFPASFSKKQRPKTKKEEKKVLTLPPARSSRPDRRRPRRFLPRQGKTQSLSLFFFVCGRLSTDALGRGEVLARLLGFLSP